MHGKMQTKTEEEMKEEVDQIMDANEFMRRQIDLFAAFIWRHQQKDDSIQLSRAANKENNTDSANPAQQPPQQISIDEYDQLERELAVDLRLKMGLTEKYLIKNEIEDLVAKSEKDLDTLRAVLEECRLRMAETKKDAYDFRRDIVISSQQPGVNDNRYSNNNLAEKIKRFITDKLKTKHGVLKKYKSKNKSLQQQISKLQEQLKISTSQSGDSFHLIDLEQLKIQNAQYNQIILERNKELLKLKMNTGQTVQQLNNFKQELAKQTKKTKVLENGNSERKALLIKLDEELSSVKKELNKQNKLLVSNKQKIQNADIPHVNDYVKQKQNEHKIQSKLKSYERKLEIAQLGAKQANKVLKRHQAQLNSSTQ